MLYYNRIDLSESILLKVITVNVLSGTIVFLLIGLNFKTLFVIIFMI